MFVVAIVVAGLLTAGCVGSLLYTKVEIVIAGISFVRFFLFVDILGLGCVGSLLNTRVEKVMAILGFVCSMGLLIHGVASLLSK